MTNISVLNIPSNGLRNFLLKPLQLIHQWSRFSQLSLPDRVNQTFKNIKKFDQFLGAISFAFQFDQVFNEGPKMNGSHLVKGDQKKLEFKKYCYSNYKTRLWTQRVGFASKVLTTITYFFPRQKQNLLLARVQFIADLGCAASNFYLEIQLRKQLCEENEKVTTEEKVFSGCRILAIAFSCTQIFLAQMPNQKAFKFTKLMLSTAMTGLAYFTLFYYKRNICIHQK